MKPASSTGFGTVSEIPLRKTPARSARIADLDTLITPSGEEEKKTVAPQKSGSRKYECKICHEVIYGDGPYVMISHNKNRHPERHRKTFASMTASKRAGTQSEKTRSKRAGVKEDKRKGTMGSILTEAQKKERQRAYQKEYRRNKKAATIKPRTTSNGHHVTNGSHPPYPFKFCPDCGKEMPTIEAKGKVIPRACRFCPDCGYQIPTQG